ncbi:MAG: hypothetical protein M3Q34_03885 [bacterium]|nr:hypothetical protein [bacterium]
MKWVKIGLEKVLNYPRAIQPRINPMTKAIMTHQKGGRQGSLTWTSKKRPGGKSGGGGASLFLKLRILERKLFIFKSTGLS